MMTLWSQLSTCYSSWQVQGQIHQPPTIPETPGTIGMIIRRSLVRAGRPVFLAE